MNLNPWNLVDPFNLHLKASLYFLKTTELSKVGFTLENSYDTN